MSMRDRARGGVIPPEQDPSEVYPQCRCPDCQEKRTEPHLYTAHDMVDAWSAGWKAGYGRSVKDFTGPPITEKTPGTP